MRAVDQLRRARALLADMWTGPEHFIEGCQRQAGVDATGAPILEWCSWRDEMVCRLSVCGALKIVCGGDLDEVSAHLDTLRELVAPVWVAEERQRAALPADFEHLEQLEQWAAVLDAASHTPDLFTWLQHRERTLDQVLAVFDRAIHRENGKT